MLAVFVSPCPLSARLSPCLAVIAARNQQQPPISRKRARANQKRSKIVKCLILFSNSIIIILVIGSSSHPRQPVARQGAELKRKTCSSRGGGGYLTFLSQNRYALKRKILYYKRKGEDTCYVIRVQIGGDMAVQVIPIEDTFPHTDTKDCHCHPCIIWYDAKTGIRYAVPLVIHHAFDQRELFEHDAAHLPHASTSYERQ